MITETEAKTKWCPFVRLLTVEAAEGTVRALPAANRAVCERDDGELEVRDSSFCRCIASECMAWRWHYRDSVGYCGLAGVPQCA